MRKSPVLLLVLSAGILQGQAAAARPAARGFDVGYTGVGAVVGIGGIGAAAASFGGRFEHAIKALPEYGNGILGFSVDADFYSYSDSRFGSGTFTFIPIGAAANFHFKLDEPKWDPFLGVGLGYSIASYSGGGGTVTANSTLYLIGRAGVRYFFSPKTAVHLDVGAGAATLNFGAMWRM